MKPNFALNLTDDRISLLHRSGQGWAHLGTAIFGADDMEAQLAAALQAGSAVAPRGGISTKIVIPNSQILYTTLDIAPGPDAARRDDIRAALTGRTPYDVDDLVFDFAGEGASVQVAVVARETLDQAEDFAVQYQFRPVAFVAVPAMGDFPGEPYFGLTKSAPTVLGKGRRVERDAEPVALAPEEAFSDAAQPLADEPVADQPVAYQPVADQPTRPDSAAATAASTPFAAFPESAPQPDATRPPVVEAVVEAVQEAAPEAVAEIAAPAIQPAPSVAPAAAPIPQSPVMSAPSTPPVDQVHPALERRPGSLTESPAEPLAESVAEPVTQTPLPTPAPAITARAFGSVIDPSVPDPDEAPFADVSDSDAADPAKAVDDDLPPAPSTAALMAFASRRAAAAAGNGNAATLPPRPFTETTIPGPVAERPAARLQGNMRPEPRVTVGSPVPAPAAGSGKKQRKAVLGGAAAPAAAPPTIAATVAPTEMPRKPLTKPGGTFASAAPVRGKPRFLGLILTGILILFLALLAAWSSFFIASRSDPAIDPPTAVAGATPATPDVLDEALADGQEPSAGVEDTAAAANQPAANLPATNLPAADIAAGPEPADPPADQTAVLAAPQTAGPAPETGVVTTGAAPANPPAEADEILLSTADQPLALQQAANLAAPELQGDTVPVAQMPPPPFGTVYEFNANGTVRAVPEGIMTPDGVRLVAGQPQRVPPARPAAIAAAALAPAPAVAADVPPVVDQTTAVGADPALADARPKARPAGLAPPPTDDDAALQGVQPVLASSPRPLPRPAAIVAANAPALPEPARASDAASLAAASAAAGTAAEAIIQDLAAVDPNLAATPSGSRLAVSVSRIPAPRPRDMERAVAAALEAATRAPAPEPEPEPAPQQVAAATPEAEPEPEVEAPVASAPTSGSVADQATFVNALNLSRINLIGVYGTQSNRYALIRQSNGRYKRVEVGDRIDGGVVAAITANEVRYQKGGRLIALQMPEG